MRPSPEQIGVCCSCNGNSSWLGGPLGVAEGKHSSKERKNAARSSRHRRRAEWTGGRTTARHNGNVDARSGNREHDDEAREPRPPSCHHTGGTRAIALIDTAYACGAKSTAAWARCSTSVRSKSSLSRRAQAARSGGATSASAMRCPKRLKPPLRVNVADVTLLAAAGLRRPPRSRARARAGSLVDDVVVVVRILR